MPFNFITFIKSRWNVNFKVMRVQSRCISRSNSEENNHLSSCNDYSLCMKHGVKNIPLFWDVTVWTGIQEQMFLQEFVASSFKAVPHSHSSWTTLEVGANRLLVNISTCIQMYMVSHPRKLKSLSAPLREPQVSQICPFSDKHSFSDVCTWPVLVTSSVQQIRDDTHITSAYLTDVGGNNGNCIWSSCLLQYCFGNFIRFGALVCVKNRQTH